MLVAVYKCLQGAEPSNLRTYLKVRKAGSYIKRGYAKLTPPAVRTTKFGLYSFGHLAPMHETNYRTLLEPDTLFIFKDKLKQFKNK